MIIINKDGGITVKPDEEVKEVKEPKKEVKKPKVEEPKKGTKKK